MDNFALNYIVPLIVTSMIANTTYFSSVKGILMWVPHINLFAMKVKDKLYSRFLGEFWTSDNFCWALFFVFWIFLVVVFYILYL